MRNLERGNAAAGLLLIMFIGVFIVGLFFAWPVYSVWRGEKEGQAELAKAEYTRQIAIAEAKAKKDSAVMLAEAEVERARGVAQANKIIGESLNNNEAYLRYLWIDSIDKTQNQIIYVPTEASLPVLEANRLHKK